MIRDWLTIEQLRNAGELYQQDINPQSRPTYTPASNLGLIMRQIVNPSRYN